MRSPLALYSFLMAWWGYWDLKQKGWQTYAVGLVTWVISFWLAGLIIRRRDEETENAQ